jgi:hypothetical protein
MENAMKVEDEKVVLQGLEGKLSDARARHAETQAKAAELAYPANTGDESARKKLDGLNSKAAMVATEVASLEAALVEARRRVDQAMAAEVDEAERRKAQDALALLDSFSKRGAQLEAGLAAFVAEYVALTREFHALDRLGYPPATWSLVQVNMALAIGTKLQATNLHQRFLAPHERRDFRDVIDGWSKHLRAKASARLNRTSKAA